MNLWSTRSFAALMAEVEDEVRADPKEPARRDDHEGEGATRGTARMEAFADGVFAISFRLPVVEIVLPEVREPGSELAHGLIELWPSYLGYLLGCTTTSPERSIAPPATGS